MASELVVPDHFERKFVPVGLAGWILRRLRRLTSASCAPEAAIHIEARLGLGPKKSLALVECRGRRVLLAISGDSVVPVLDFQEEAARGPRKPCSRKDAGQ